MNLLIGSDFLKLEMTKMKVLDIFLRELLAELLKT